MERIPDENPVSDFSQRKKALSGVGRR
jgi:hypothetical protein